MCANRGTLRRWERAARSPARIARVVSALAVLVGTAAVALGADARGALYAFTNQMDRTEATLVDRFGDDLTADDLPPHVREGWADLTRLRGSLPARVRDLEDRVAGLEDTVRAVASERSVLEAESAALARETATWRQQFDDLAREADRCLAEIEAHRARRPGPNASRATVEAYNNEASRLQTWYDGLAARRSRLQAEAAGHQARDRALVSRSEDLAARERAIGEWRAALESDEGDLARDCREAEDRARALTEERGRAIGAAGAVSGTVTAVRPWGGPPVVIRSGDAVYLGDDVVTGPDGRMQVLLLDETVFTVGPDSELTLDEFVYDPFTEEGKLAATIAKGAIRFVSGQIAARQPEKVGIRLPVGTIGVRGTDFVVRIGGGGATDIDVLDGSVAFVADRGGEAARIDRGERLRIGADGTIRERTTFDAARVRGEWQAGRRASRAGSSAAKEEPPPFRPLHLWIACAALLILFVCMASNTSGWILAPMVALAFLFTTCVDSCAPGKLEGWWFWWWLGVSSAGYVLYVGVFKVAVEIGVGVASVFSFFWPLELVVGGVGVAAGLVFAFDGGETLYRFGSEYVWPRTRFAPELTWIEPLPYVKTLMYSAWAVVGAGLIVVVAGIRTIRMALARRAHDRRPPAVRRYLPVASGYAARSKGGTCRACGEPCGTRRTIRCSRCGKVVHHYGCLSPDPHPEGRVCRACRPGPTRPPEPAPALPLPSEATRAPRSRSRPVPEPAICPVCGEALGGGRSSQCGECRRFVHRANCLGRTRVPGGRLCRVCEREPRKEAPVAPPATESPFDAQCPECGVPLSREDRFCPGCVRPLDEDVPSTAAEAEPPSAASEPAPEPAAEPAPAPAATEEQGTRLTGAERRVEIERALVKLEKLGIAAAQQYAIGNGRAYEHVQRQIAEFGRHLRERGGIGLVDAVYGRFERTAGGAAVREVTEGFRSGIADWSV